MDVKLIDKEGKVIDTDALAREAHKEERKINSNIRHLVGEQNTEQEILSDDGRSDDLSEKIAELLG